VEIFFPEGVTDPSAVAFDACTKAKGQEFDIVIVDPPSRQPGSFVADKDYARVLSRLPSVLAQGAELLLCVNAPALGEEWLKELVSEHLPGARFRGRLLNRCDFPELDASRNLKMLGYVFDSGSKSDTPAVN